MCPGCQGASPRGPSTRQPCPAGCSLECSENIGDLEEGFASAGLASASPSPFPPAAVAGVDPFASGPPTVAAVGPSLQAHPHDDALDPVAAAALAEATARGVRHKPHHGLGNAGGAVIAVTCTVLQSSPEKLLARGGWRWCREERRCGLPVICRPFSRGGLRFACQNPAGLPMLRPLWDSGCFKCPRLHPHPIPTQPPYPHVSIKWPHIRARAAPPPPLPGYLRVQPPGTLDGFGFSQQTSSMVAGEHLGPLFYACILRVMATHVKITLFTCSCPNPPPPILTPPPHPADPCPQAILPIQGT